MKKHGYNIVNTMIFLLEMNRYLENRNKYRCLGGERFAYIDWNLDVYPCMCKGKPINIEKYSFDKFQKSECNKCMLQCFREPSILLSNRKRTTKIALRELPFMPVIAIKRFKTMMK